MVAIRNPFSPVSAHAAMRWLQRVGVQIARGLRPSTWRRQKTYTTFCREGFYYLLVMVFVFVAAVMADVNLLIALAGMMLGPLWLSRRLVAVTLRGLQVRRKMPSGLCAGDMLVVDLELSNTRPRLGSWALIVEEQIHREGDAGRPRPVRTSVFFPYVPAGQGRERAYRGRLPQRGRYRLGPLRISTRFPFGFFRRVITLEAIDVLTVYPRLGQLTKHWRARHHLAFEGAERRERRHGGVSGEYYGVRPWRSGDSRRLIHWRSSARHGTLMVRQFDQQRNRDLAVLVEVWQPSEPSLEQLENIELAVSFAATVVEEACRKGGSDLVIGTTAQPADSLHGPASAALLHDAMGLLATAEGHSPDRLAELLEQVFLHVDRGTEVVLISTRPVDLTDPRRFAAFGGDPQRRALLGQIRAINTADPGLSQFFQST